MYQPAHFVQDDVHALRDLMLAHPLATLVSVGPNGPTADHIPLEYDPDVGAKGTLRGHVARANALWRAADGQPVLAVFRGAEAYVSPTWYASKAEHHKVVPTWNYAVVHAHGRLRAVDDPVWLRDLVGRLTRRHESQRARPWSVEDAPPEYIEQMLRAIVGIEIELTDLVGKFKLSQNRSEADRRGVADGLSADGQPLLAGWIRPAVR